MIRIIVKKYEGLPVYKITTDIKGDVIKSSYKVYYMIGSRERVMERVSNLIYKIKDNKKVLIDTEVDSLFRYDILFTLRNKYSIDLNGGR